MPSRLLEEGLFNRLLAEGHLNRPMEEVKP